MLFSRGQTRQLPWCDETNLKSHLCNWTNVRPSLGYKRGFLRQDGDRRTYVSERSGLSIVMAHENQSCLLRDAYESIIRKVDHLSRLFQDSRLHQVGITDRFVFVSVLRNRFINESLIPGRESRPSYWKIVFTFSLVNSCEGSALLQSNPLMHCASTSPDKMPPSILLRVPSVKSCYVRMHPYLRIEIRGGGIFTIQIIDDPLAT